jgi:hypothetical protein
MTDKPNPQWTRHLEAIADELLHLSVACDLRLGDPGVIERIINDDRSVCGRKNEIGFRKLRKLVMATYDSLGKALDRVGPEETKEIVDSITEHLAARREGRVNNSGDNESG